MDREKVINDLQDAVNDDWMWQHADYYAKAMENAIALLKEHEQAMKEKDGTISNLIAQIKEISQCYERVVRCKDCFYGEVAPDDNSYFFCTHPLHRLESHESHYYCADGRKKDEAV